MLQLLAWHQGAPKGLKKRRKNRDKSNSNPAVLGLATVSLAWAKQILHTSVFSFFQTEDKCVSGKNHNSIFCLEETAPLAADRQRSEVTWAFMNLCDGSITSASFVVGGAVVDLHLYSLRLLTPPPPHPPSTAGGELEGQWGGNKAAPVQLVPIASWRRSKSRLSSSLRLWRAASVGEEKEKKKKEGKKKFLFFF